MKHYSYDEPNPDGTNNRVIMNEQEVLERMRHYAKLKGKSLTDEELIEEFKTVNWAWESRV